jgi:hypothetical protein
MSAEMSEPKLYHGWFSQKQKDNCRNLKQEGLKRPISNIYLAVGEVEVEVTEVCYEMRDHKKNFKDSQYKGEFIKWVRGIYN